MTAPPSWLVTMVLVGLSMLLLRVALGTDPAFEVRLHVRRHTNQGVATRSAATDDAHRSTPGAATGGDFVAHATLTRSLPQSL